MKKEFRVYLAIAGLLGFGLIVSNLAMSSESSEIAPDTVKSPLSIGAFTSPSTPTLVQVSPNNYVVDLGIEITGQDTYLELADGLEKLSSKDTVRFKLHNYGGSVIGMLYLANAIATSQAYTIAIVEGPSYSAGANIACVTNEYVMQPYSFLMYHTFSVNGASAKGQELSAIIEAMTVSTRSVFNQCVKKGILTEQDVNELLLGNDKYVFPKN